MIGGVRAWSKGEYYCWRTRDRKGLCLCCVFILCCDLYLCCFCKLLGLYSCICRLLWFVSCLCSLYALFYLLCSLVLLVKCFHFLQVLSLLCPSRIFFLDAYILCALVECWTCKWYFAFKLISLHVQMFIPYENEHCDHYSIVIACVVEP